MKYIYIYIYVDIFTNFLYLLNATDPHPYLIGNTVLSFKSRTEQNNDRQLKSANSDPKCEPRFSQHKMTSCPTDRFFKFHIL